MKKRLLSLLLAIMLVLSLTSCAGNTTGETTAPTEDTSSADVAAEAATPEESEAPEDAAAFDPQSLPYVAEETHFTGITGFPPFFNNIVSDAGQDFQALRVASERTGIYVDWTTVSSDVEEEQFMLIVASGEYPDMLNNAANYYSGGEDKAVEDEVLIDLTKYIAEYAPNIQQILDTDETLRKSVMTGEGRIVSFFSCLQDPEPFPNPGGMGIRQDWLDALELDVPQTYDDLYAVLKAFKSEYNAGMFITQSGDDSHFSLTAGYGVTRGDLYVVDGVVKTPYLEDGYLEFLTMLHGWYDEGLIDPDFVSYSEEFINTHLEVATSGDNGVYPIDTDMIENIPAGCDDPDCVVSAVQPITKTAGETLHLGHQETRLSNKHWAISTACKDPATLTKYVNYFFTDDGVILTNYGVEDVSYRVNENGEYEYTELITDNPDLPVAFAMYLYTNAMSIPYMNIYSRDSFTLSDRQKEAREVWMSDDNDFAWNMPGYVSLTADESTEYASLMADIETAVDENVMKFIVGDRSIDEYSDFVETLKKLNIDRAVEIYQTAYDRVSK